MRDVINYYKFASVDHGEVEDHSWNEPRPSTTEYITVLDTSQNAKRQQFQRTT